MSVAIEIDTDIPPFLDRRERRPMEGKSMTASAQREPDGQLVTLAPTAAITPMEMLDRAVAQGANIETLQQLMALQERWDRNQARKAFDEAMAQTKAEIPVIIKNRQVGFESRKAGAARTDYKHEDLGEIARTIDPILSKHGLSYRWRTTSAINEPVTVTCIVSHRLGHSEENTLAAGRDDTGNKNSIQAVGSTITYLQRYTLKAALGLAAAEDDDAKAAGAATLSEDQLEKLRSLIVEVGADIQKFCAYMKTERLEDIPAGKFQAAVDALNAKRKATAS